MRVTEVDFRRNLYCTTCVVALIAAALASQRIGSALPASQASIPPITTVLATSDAPPPTVKLGEVLSIQLGPQAPVSEQEAARIRKLIASLAALDSPDFGLSPTLTGSAFAPIPGSEHASTLLLTDHGLKRSDPFRELVALGPRSRSEERRVGKECRL